jgi:hypothetical protein
LLGCALTSRHRTDAVIGPTTAASPSAGACCSRGTGPQRSMHRTLPLVRATRRSSGKGVFPRCDRVRDERGFYDCGVAACGQRLFLNVAGVWLDIAGVSLVFIIGDFVTANPAPYRLATPNRLGTCRTQQPCPWCRPSKTLRQKQKASSWHSHVTSMSFFIMHVI